MLEFKQYRQCTYKVTFSRVHGTIVVVEKQYVLHMSVCACARARV